MAYIYQITNKINNKIYIGKTEFSIEKRFKEHCRDAFRERNEKRPLYAAIRKYGVENFKISLIEETDNPEEREVYWIEKKGSFKNGYNATLGGDGRKYLDYELIISTYKQVQSITDVVKILQIDKNTVNRILKENNVEIKSTQQISTEKYGIIVHMYTKDNQYVKTFDSLANAARYLIENNLTNCKFTTIRTHISEASRGKRKSAAGFIWKLDEKRK